jgi:hypothetical protein
MTPWIAVAALYAIGLIGLHAMARDIQQAPVKGWRARSNLILWPLVVPIGAIGDLCDKIRGDR